MTPTEAVAKRVRELRAARKWSAERCAENMAALGFDWTRSTVANLENGRRGQIPVEEIFGLARLFGVPVTVLLLPDDENGLYRMLPDEEVTASTAFAWLTGSGLPGYLPPYMRP